MVQKELNMQKEKDFLKKKKLTNKELTQAILGIGQDGINNNKNIQFLTKKSFLFETLFSLLFEYDKEFYKIVMNHYAKEVEKPRSSDKKGA